MKLTVKFNGKRSQVTLQELSFRALKLACLQLCCRDVFSLSLNGKNILKADDDIPLEALGVVNGDLIHIVCEAKLETAAAGTSNSAQACQVEQEKDEQEETISETEEKDDVADEVKILLSLPFTVAESTTAKVPEKLQLLYSKAQPQNAKDAVLIILHCLLEETGFFMTDDADSLSNEKVTDILSKGLGAKGTCQLHYALVGVPTARCRVTLVVMASVLVIHGSLAGKSKQPCKVSVRPSDFFSQSPSNDAAQSYRILPGLARLLKDGLCFRLSNAVRASVGLPTGGLGGLFSTLKLAVLRYLPLRDVLSMSLVNFELSQLTQDASIWRSLYLRDFGGARDASLGRDWQDLYQRRYAARVDYRRQRDRLVPYLVGPPPLSWLPPRPAYPPGVIGGDYDLNPLGGAGIGIPGRGRGGLLPRQPRSPRFPSPYFRDGGGLGGGFF